MEPLRDSKNQLIVSSAHCRDWTMRFLATSLLILLLPILFVQCAPNIERMESSTVQILVKVDKHGGVIPFSGAGGSGFVIGKNLVVTNAHVALDREDIEEHLLNALLQTSDGTRLGQRIQEEVAIAIREGRVSNQEEQARFIQQRLDQEFGPDVRTEMRGVGAITMFVMLSKDKFIQASVKWKDKRKDLAVLQLEEPLDRPVVTFARSDLMEKLQEVIAMGFPGVAERGTVESILEVKDSEGSINAIVEKDERGRRLYQIDAVINHGSSGGPLFNLCGHVIGVNSEGRDPGFNWAIQIDELLPELDQLGIPYTTASMKCIDWGEYAGVGMATFLGMISLIIASTKTGRKQAKKVVIRGQEAIQQTFYPKPVSRKPYLKGLSGDYAGSELDLGDQPLTMGRDPRMAQLILSSSSISRRHCVLRYEKNDNAFLLEDAWSTNGTFLTSGEKLKPRESKRLKSGDRFYLAEPLHMFEVYLEKST